MKKKPYYFIYDSNDINIGIFLEGSFVLDFLKDSVFLVHSEMMELKEGMLINLMKGEGKSPIINR